MTKSEIISGVANILNNYELCGILSHLNVLCDKGRSNKHVCGKTIRRRNKADEEFYGKCKNLKSIFILATQERKFHNLSTEKDLISPKDIAFVENAIAFIEAETIMHWEIISSVKQKLSKLKKDVQPC